MVDGLLSVRIETSDGTSLMIKEAGGVSVWLCAGIVVRDDSLKVGRGQGHYQPRHRLPSWRWAVIETSCNSRSTYLGLDMIIWLPVALLSWVELQQVGAAVVVASVVAAVGHRNLHRGVVRSGGQEVRRSGG